MDFPDVLGTPDHGHPPQGGLSPGFPPFFPWGWGVAWVIRGASQLDRIPFPVMTDTILLWSALFNPGRSFAQYIAHVMKACILLHQPTDWLDPAVRSVSRGLKNAQDLSFKFQNYLMAADLLRLLQVSNLNTEFGQAAFFSFLFILRVPSETLWMRKASPSDRLTEFYPQDHKVLVGIRIIDGQEFLLAKFAWRKNMKHGCIVRRPCLCHDGLPLARAVCPVHRIWHRISSRVRSYEFLFPSFSAGKFAITLKSNMIKAGYEFGSRFSSHCFRRGATQELKIDGASDKKLQGAGCWRGMGFRAYADTQLTDALKISRLIAKATASDSEDDPDAPHNVAFMESLRKRLRPFPARELIQVG